MGLARIKRKIDLHFRKKREVDTRSFSAAEVRNFRFYQFKRSTADFFFSKKSRTDIRVTDTPHYALAKALHGGDAAEITQAAAFYTDYLSASWQTTDAVRLQARVDDFKKHWEHFKAHPGKADPVVVSRLEQNGDFFVIDGNHRSAFSAALGHAASVEVWPIDLAFLRFSDIRRFYGTGHMNRPYQSIFLHQQVVIPGRRNDALERLKMIPPHVLQGQSVLDIASNFGMSSLLAKSLGAKTCKGLEISPEMVDFATRFAMFDGAYPDVKFQTFNVDEETLAAEEKYDTAFMFSIHDHLKKPEKLLEMARKNIAKYVVFEGHPQAQRDKYGSFFDSGIFKSVTTLGALPESVFQTERKNRILWLCEKK